jgi:hypothetical protein
MTKQENKTMTALHTEKTNQKKRTVQNVEKLIALSYNVLRTLLDTLDNLKQKTLTLA